MFVASLNFADDYGNLDRSSKQLKVQTMPYDEGDGEAIVSELLRLGLFIEYQVDGKFYLHIKNFEVHQRVDHPSKSRLPLYDPSLSTQRQLKEPSENPREPSRSKVRDSKGREGKGVSIPSESHSDLSEIAIVFEHWKSVWDHPKASLDVKRSAAIKKALTGYGSADLCASISGYRNSPHHTGQNDRQTVYDDIGLLLRDAAHIDAGIAFAAKPAGLTSDLANHNVRVLQEWGEAHARNGSGEIPSDVSESRGSIRETAIAAAHGALLGRPKASGH